MATTRLLYGGVPHGIQVGGVSSTRPLPVFSPHVEAGLTIRELNRKGKTIGRSMENFTAIPNEWFDNLADGRLTPPMFDILCYLMRTCTWSKGEWRGEAERIRYGLGKAWSVSQINRHLTRLDNCRYIDRRNTPGRRGGYKILINNYAHDEKILRPTELKDWRDIKDVDAQQDASDDACEMRVSCVGHAQDDACEMRSNLDVPDVDPDLQDIPDLPDVTQENIASKPASQQVPPSADSTAPGSSAMNENLPTTVDEFWSDDFVETEAKNLLLGLKPNLTDHLVKEQLPMTVEILSLVPEHMDASDLLQWNHAHRSGKYASKQDKLLYLRSPKQMLAALRSQDANLVNDYDLHDFANCPTCKPLGIVHTTTLRAAIEADRKRREEQRQAELLAMAEADREAAELAAKRERWSNYDWSRKRNDSDRKQFAFHREFDRKKIGLRFEGSPDAVLDAAVIHFAKLGRSFSWEEFEETFLDIWEAHKDLLAERQKASAHTAG